MDSKDPEPGELSASKLAPSAPEESSRQCCILSPQMASSQAWCITHIVDWGVIRRLKRSNGKGPPKAKHRNLTWRWGGGGIDETKGLARWAEAKKADGARF